MSTADTLGAASNELLLPRDLTACLFDMDGVLTDTAKLHTAAWEQTFDAYLLKRGRETGEVLRPFDASADYEHFVDGKTRVDGVRSFLASRGIELQSGLHSDPAGTETVAGLSRLKNDIVLGLIHAQGVRAYPGSVRFVQAARSAGLRTAVVTSSANCAEVLTAARIAQLFEVTVDGIVIDREGLEGKPAPDTYLHAALTLGVRAAQAAVFEDSLAGVEAGRAGGFGHVVGVNRLDQASALRTQGADVVVSDLIELISTP